LFAITLFDSHPGDAKRDLFLLLRAVAAIGLPSAVERGKKDLLGVRRQPANRGRQITVVT
jgi:hypothetical protein